MTTAFEIADRFTERWADLSPISATVNGIGGRDDIWDDFSPDGEAERMEAIESVRGELAPSLADPDPMQAAAAGVLIDWLDLQIAAYERGNWDHDLNHIFSPFQSARDTFDVVSKADAAAWERIARRLETLDQPYTGYRESLALGLSRGNSAARRQVLSVIEQARAVAGEDSRFAGFPAQAAEVGGDADRVAAAVDKARAASGELAHWLETEYLPRSRQEDGVGEEEYVASAGEHLGMTIDPYETYQWGWDEVRRLMGEMASTAAAIDDTKTVDEVVELLDNDPDRSAPDHASFAHAVQDIQDTAVRQLDGTHFDVPEVLRKVTVNIAPPGGSLGAWYHSPSEDFSRPGSIWYAPGERVRIPMWTEVSTAYHEGFPGHHLQLGIALINRDQLSRFHRIFIWYPGAGEGWALYAEHLMDELGYFEKPEYRLGLLASQLFRATRVVVDVGTQLSLRIPDDAPLHPGEPWSYYAAVDYIEKLGFNARDVAESEVKRYLGWFAQAISYKVGEREILKIRESAMSRLGPEFDRKAFHRQMLDLGAIGLDRLREAMA